MKAANLFLLREKMKFIFLSAILFSTLFLPAQNINFEHFNKRIYNCNFSSSADAKIWPSENNADNLFVIQDNIYFTERKNTSKDIKVFPGYSPESKNFRLNIVLNQNDDIPAGVCFNFDSKHINGFYFLINNKRQYLVKKTEPNGAIKYITGTNERNAWKKFSFLEKPGMTNEIDILTLDNRIEIYVNNFYLFGFEELIKYDTRDFGIYLYPGASVSVSSVSIFVSEEDMSDITISNDINKLDGNETNVSDTDPSRYLEKIIELNKKNEELAKELSETIELLDKCKEDNMYYQSYISDHLNSGLENAIEKLKEENYNLSKQIDGLKAENKSLQQFKEYYTNNTNDSDIINFLYDELHKLEEENATLKRKLKLFEKQ